MKIEPFALQGLIRDKFNQNELTENNVADDPFHQFSVWLAEARQTGIFPFPTAFSLSTLSRDNFPSSRTVIMRSQSSDGILFYTQYGSAKALDISHNPNVCAHFYWPIIERQIQINGVCNRISEEEADDGFRELSRENQLAAWASLQSEEVNKIAELEEKFSGFEKLFQDRQIPRPSRWGGFKIEPVLFEFWQHRPFHFNDRIRYKPNADGSWIIQRISP